MELTILGFMGGYPSKGIGTTSYLLTSADFRLLIDVGSQAVIALERHLDPLDLDALILTHYHPDHIADLGVLQHTFLLKERQDGKEKTILPIYGHQESELEKLRNFPHVSEAINYQADETLQLGPFDIQFLRTVHPVVCYALSIIERDSGKKFVFTADSGYLADLVDFSRDADLLLADTNFYAGNENHPVHMTSKEVGELAKAADVKSLVLTHLPPDGDWQRLLDEAQLAADHIKVTLAKEDLTIQL